MKNANIKTKIKLGVFVLSVAVIAGLSLLLAGDEMNFFKQSRNYKAHFKNASGLVEGAPVRIGGVEVGRVARIEIETADGILAIAATLRIDSPYYELVNRNASVALDTQGLLGDKFVSLYPGSSSDGGALADNAVIATRDTDNIAKIVERSSTILDQVNNTTRKIDTFVSGLPDGSAVDGVTQDFSASARALRILMNRMAADDSFIAVLNDAASRQQLRHSLASLESTTAHMEAIARKIDNGEGTLGALVNDRSMYEDMRAILGRVDRGRIARRVFIEAADADQDKQEKAR